ncbi:hypothetical protein C8D88_102770 [Lentzea atacamensis]|uniref:Uncharacterized protein n=2 Tax=Lentzea atacamensis TaxID=531938 RepID=A0A316IAK4_9PSEU|nr:hypothetical protein C8D88_102770 [Lentzea atacamensis]
MSEPTAVQRLLQFAEQVRVPETVSPEGLAARFGAPSDLEVRVGQVWRARWDDISALLLITGVEDLTIEGVPVTLDLPAADDRVFVVEGTLTAFGVDATAWIGLSERFPLRVLEQPVDRWIDELVDGIRAAVADDAATAPPEPAARIAFASEAVMWAELADDLAALRAVPALPHEVEGESPTTLRSLFGKGLDLRVLVEALRPLGYAQPDVMALLNGKKPLTPDAADAVAKVTGFEREKIEAAVVPLPRGFVAEVDHPRWRQVWQRRAERYGLDEATARLDGSYEFFARAARETGSGQVDWRARLTQYVQREEDGSAGR